MGGIMDHLLPPEVFQKQVETVESDSEFDMELWKKKLTAMGYERVGPVSYTHLDVYKRQGQTQDAVA